MPAVRALLTFAVVAAACGGSQSTGPGVPTAATAVAATPMGAHSCDRAGLQPVAPGKRRVELALDANPGATEVSVDGATRVAAKSGTACAHVELDPGEHQVVVLSRGDEGLGAHLKMMAAHPKEDWWYDLFNFDCGQPTCEKGPLADWGRAAQADRKAMTDPCSAMQIRNIKWESERAPGRDLVTGLRLTFTVFLYKDAFNNQPRDPACPEN